MARPKKTETTASETKKPTTRKSRTKKTETAPVEEQVSEVLEETPQTEEPKPIGTLFNVINYNNVEDLDRFIQNLTQDQALYCVVQAARAGHQRSAYGMEESEVVSKAIRVLTTPPAEQQQEVPEPEVHKA
jgi:hypothetical protein